MSSVQQKCPVCSHQSRWGWCETCRAWLTYADNLKRAIRNALAQLGDTSPLATIEPGVYSGDPGHAAAYLRDALRDHFPEQEPPSDFLEKALNSR